MTFLFSIEALGGEEEEERLRINLSMLFPAGRVGCGNNKNLLHVHCH